jgi:hypothetical protein
MIRLLLILFLLALPLMADTFYVDSDATGANDGTSWADAWTEMDQISWGAGAGQVGPGDTVYVSGGSYSTALRIDEKGTAANPIQILAAQEEGHNDPILHASTVGAFADSAYCTISGAKTDGVETTITNTWDVRTIVPTNCNWFTLGIVSGDGAGRTNITYSWLSVSNLSGVNDAWGIQMQHDTIAGNVLEYCWIHDVEDSGLVRGDGGHAGFDSLIIRWNYWTNCGDDYIEWQPGCTAHNNYFDRQDSRHGHPDGVAGSMGYSRIYNNIFRDIWDQIVYQKIWETVPDSQGNVQVYGNLFFVDQGAITPKADGIQVASSFGWETGRFTSGTGSQSGTTVTATSGTPFSGNGQVSAGSVVYFADGTTATVISMDSPTSATVTPSQTVGSQAFDVTSVPPTNYWGGLVFANNSVIGDDTVTAGKLLNSISLVNTYSVDNSAGRAFTNVVVVTNMLVKNNVFYKVPQGAGSFKDYDGGFSYGSEDIVYDYNSIYSTVTAGDDISYMGTDYTNVAAFNSGTAYVNNQDGTPAFNDAASFDFTPAGGDTVLRDNGDDLTALNLPNWHLDLSGNNRTNDGTVDIGALEFTPDDQLLLHLTFEDDFEANGYAVDQSGNGHTAYDFTLSTNGYIYITPEPTPVERVAANTVSGNNTNGYAGLWRWGTNNWGLYTKSGSFLGVTNVSDMMSLTQATICVWAKYNHYTNIAGAGDVSADGNANMLETGSSTGVAGTWLLGRRNAYDSENQTRWMVMTNNLAEPSLAYVDFPDVPTTTGDTTNWQHYAVVWNAGSFTNYFNGVLVTNSSITSTNALTFGRNTAGEPYWLGIGANPHGGTPELDEESEDYPNNGWFNGYMDDIRIYNRVLTATEIAALAGSDAEEPPAQAARRLRVNTLRF